MVLHLIKEVSKFKVFIEAFIASSDESLEGNGSAY